MLFWQQGKHTGPIPISLILDLFFEADDQSRLLLYWNS
jgi:hypothetical protein